MKIIPVKTKTSSDGKPRVCWALLFPDADTPEVLADYRNALTQCAKYILSSEDTDGRMDDELFFIIQLAEFITVGIDNFHKENTTWENFVKTQLHELAVEVRRRKEEGGSDEAA